VTEFYKLLHIHSHMGIYEYVSKCLQHSYRSKLKLQMLSLKTICLLTEPRFQLYYTTVRIKYNTSSNNRIIFFFAHT